jgi:hypothetical protein
MGVSVIALLGLAGCSSIDDALFGSDTDQAAPAAGADQAAAAGSDQAAAPAEGDNSTAGTMASAPTEGAMPAAAPGAGTSTAGITPIAIEAGSDTGTAVNREAQRLRAKVSGVQDKMVADAQKFAQLQNAAIQSSQTYHEAKANIAARLQLGTTRGNPELVAQWNTAQAALDSMTSDINQLTGLATEIADGSSNAHYALNTIEATFNVSGAVDEDHRQLTVLRDETDQVIVLVDSLLTNVSSAVQRQTTYVANERASLTTLAAAIKDGSYYGDLGAPAGGIASRYTAGPVSGPALVTIRFDHTHVDYQQILYTAVAQAMQARPSSVFAVVAVSPTRGSSAAVQLAQTEAERHARQVVSSLGGMGIPATRIHLSSMTDPSINASEVRVFVR